MILPLKGIQIVTLAVNVPGPVAAAGLRELGASIVKVEPPDGDPLATYSYEWYQHLIRGQEVINLDLKQTEQREKFNDLLGSVDISSEPNQ
ncbi:MAG: CoA transferase [Acidobacteriota bacterium]|nr:CoA transferase [Acidobacteriota bacterium]